jgi:cytoskeletal protein CcmA (bactofilin family)
MFNKPKTTNKRPTPPSLFAENLTIEGNLNSTGDLQIDGTVTGDITCRILTLGEDGVVNGEIRAETVHVRGRVEGRIIAATVELAASANITGDILHDSLGVEAGARVEGNLKRRPSASAEPVKLIEGTKPSLVLTNS